MGTAKKKVKKSGVRGAKAKKDLLAIERAAKRAEQKAQGALDGRFREKVVDNKKKYSRKGKHKDPPSDTELAE